MRGWGISVATPRARVIEVFARGGLVVSFHSLLGVAAKHQILRSFDQQDAEALQVTFDPNQVTYHQLLEFFYKMHDPTTEDRQGGDSGTQYRSAIFYHDEEQEKTAKEITEKVQKEWWRAGKITTQLLPAGEWWDAETYHQLYLDKNPGGYECPAQ